MMLVSGWAADARNFALANSPDSAVQLGRSIERGQSTTVSSGRRLASLAPEWGNATNFVLATQLAAIRRDRQIAVELNRLRQQVQGARQSLAQDVQTVESWNASIREVNDRVLPIVKTVTGQDLGTDRDSWLRWWNDQLGYAYQSPSDEDKPTYTEYVSVPLYTSPPHGACFAAGTSVQTIDGARAIEQVQVGDRVLSQDSTTGALSFQPVMLIHHNPPSPTLKLQVGEETLVATGIHRFWKAGSGWTMARDLKPGDIVRTVGGLARLESVEAGNVEPVFNLDVAQNRNFFVGKHGCLVYDFSIVQPVLAPFDRVPDLTALATTSRPPQ